MTMNDLDKRIREYMKWLDEHYYEAFDSKEAYDNYEYDDGRCDAYDQAYVAFERIFNVKEETR